MSRKLLPISFTAALIGGTAAADAPSVAVDITPVHSLVARVMEGVGTPNLVIPAGASPHHYSLKPSEAKALQDSDVVFWMGEDLAPWLQDAVETLADDADVTALLEADGTVLHEFREDALFEKHDHGDEEHGHEDEHGHDEHAEKQHDHEEDHDEHAHDEHGHGAHDPHAWLSPSNAAAWLDLIAAELSAADPDNASAYFANAAAGRAEMEAMSAEVNEILAPVRGGSFVVFHDAYQYFEKDFNVPASGAISFSDASDPSPARIAEIQGRVRDEGIECVLAEPQFNPGIVATILDGTKANTAVIDPLGAELELGPNLYPQLIRNMATTLAGCL
ncbi:zinc ABC transporter substrate-binding protein [Aliiroseovarius sp. Z3]|uniref:zinc ABC transporter substrate-binding protein n=1 Tax=Aliiroseovarius sp. Z3 TaxID=2811402 RepID=UPI0023B24BBF|nr:zinc ABC transporter substrate-binding protein [Aliiroseovarius sp. Z3]MDE9450292.1 zinc ABC transporter substrate-binding protein [Aliiroseovarius sp. Z3]